MAFASQYQMKGQESPPEAATCALCEPVLDLGLSARRQVAIADHLQRNLYREIECRRIMRAPINHQAFGASSETFKLPFTVCMFRSPDPETRGPGAARECASHQRQDARESTAATTVNVLTLEFRSATRHRIK